MLLEKKISQAKAKLLVDYPLFGTIASRLELIKNDDIEAFKSDGTTLEYSSDFFQNLTTCEMQFVFANGAMHASLAHENRKNGRSGWLWQLSTDYAINDMLVQNGMSRPYQTHYSKRFEGLYAEEIYAELKDDILRDELEYEGDDSSDTQPENKNQKNDKKIDLNEQLFQEFAKATIDSKTATDEMPLGMQRFFTIKDDAKIDWRKELRVAIDKFHKDDYTLMPPNKKFLHLGIYLPSSSSQKVKFAVAIDSSGSVDESLLSDFLSELNFLMNTISSYEITLFVCDDRIRSKQIFYSGDILEVKILGGGGTDFRPVFESIDKEIQDINLLLYFSDLEGTFPKESPSYDVKWITPKERDIPFGEMIVLEEV